MVEALNHRGPYLGHEPVALFQTISQKSFDILNKARGGDIRKREKPLDHLWTRMLYVSESVSVAIRVNASWALSIPAMSLVRDRYEQTVRFSWLIRQKNREEILKYADFYQAKAMAVSRNLSEPQRHKISEMGFHFPQWQTASLTKEEREKIESWGATNLLDLCKKRDKICADDDNKIGRRIQVS